MNLIFGFICAFTCAWGSCPNCSWWCHKSSGTWNLHMQASQCIMHGNAITFNPLTPLFRFPGSTCKPLNRWWIARSIKRPPTGNVKSLIEASFLSVWLNIKRACGPFFVVSGFLDSFVPKAERGLTNYAVLWAGIRGCWNGQIHLFSCWTFGTIALLRRDTDNLGVGWILSMLKLVGVKRTNRLKHVVCNFVK